MATASIRFDGQPTNYVGLVKGTPVVVSNNDNSGVTSWIYELVGKPAKSTLILGVLSGEPTPTPVGSTTKFTPDIEGTYKIRLRVNGSVIDEGLSAVLYIPSNLREPLVGEQLGWNTQEGWARALKDVFEKLNWYAHSGTKPAAAVEHYGKIWHTLHGTNDLFDVCVKVGGSYQWVSLMGAGGGGTYTAPGPLVVAHGGAVVGRTYVAEPIPNVLTEILFPYQYPAFTLFDISGQANPLEVGNSIPAGVTFRWDHSNDTNVVTPGVSIWDHTLAPYPGGPALAGGLPTGAGIRTHPMVLPGGPIQRTTPGSHQFQIRATNNRPPPGPDVLTRLATYTWYWRLFYGINASASLTEAQAKALIGQLLTNTASRTYSFAAGASQYKYVVFPTSLAAPTVWKDQATNLDVPFTTVTTTLSITNGFGQNTNYTVQRSLNMLGAAMNIIVS